MDKKILIIILTICTVILSGRPCFAKRTVIPVTGKVNSFGAYSYTGKLEFDIKKPGEQNIGAITVEGVYNGEYPWIMRIYTDNTNYTGIAGSARAQNPAGLVSTDGRFVIPLAVNAPGMKNPQYKIIPDINQNDYKPYKPDKLGAPVPGYTDCIIMGIDPANELWTAGENGVLFDDDDNILGEMLAPTPFDLKFKSRFNETAVSANYTANLYIEIVSCP